MMIRISTVLQIARSSADSCDHGDNSRLRVRSTFCTWALLYLPWERLHGVSFLNLTSTYTLNSTSLQVLDFQNFKNTIQTMTGLSQSFDLMALWFATLIISSILCIGLYAKIQRLGRKILRLSGKLVSNNAEIAE